MGPVAGRRFGTALRPWIEYDLGGDDSLAVAERVAYAAVAVTDGRAPGKAKRQAYEGQDWYRRRAVRERCLVDQHRRDPERTRVETRDLAQALEEQLVEPAEANAR